MKTLCVVDRFSFYFTEWIILSKQYFGFDVSPWNYDNTECLHKKFEILYKTNPNKKMLQVIYNYINKQKNVEVKEDESNDVKDKCVI